MLEGGRELLRAISGVLWTYVPCALTHPTTGVASGDQPPRGSGRLLLFEEGGNQHGINTSDLDPLLGVEPVSDPAQYADFVNPNTILVSPVYKSDVGNTTPGVNALGERRGLVAFKIIAVGSDPDGSGSALPNLVVQIVDPQMLGGLGGIRLINGAGGSIQIVQ